MRKKMFERAIPAVGVVLIALTLSCCESGPGASSGFDARSSAGVFDDPNPGAGAAMQSGWTIVLATFSGPEARRAAVAALPAIQSGSGFVGLFVEHRKRGSFIASGRYQSEMDPAAVADLRRFRAYERDGIWPFGRAFLAPPVGGAAGNRPEINLARAPEIFGREALYTLQVAVYESDNRRESMRAAEEAAFIYRQDGELAFYYHGPTRSMVTIGVFGEDDIDVEAGLESPELVALRARRPLNLFNGMAIRETVSGQTRNQASRLVRIP